MGPPTVEVVCAVGQFCPSVPLYTLHRGGAALTLSAPTGAILGQTWPPGQQAAFDVVKQQLPPTAEPPPLPPGAPTSAVPAAFMSPRLVIQGAGLVRPAGPYMYEFRWAAPDGGGGWSRSTAGDTASALASIRSAPPNHVAVGTQLAVTIDPPPAGVELLAWRGTDPAPSPLGSGPLIAVLQGTVVYEVRATWDYAAAGQGKAAYLFEIDGV